jgi:hypothetical protein
VRPESIRHSPLITNVEAFPHSVVPMRIVSCAVAALLATLPHSPVLRAQAPPKEYLIANFERQRDVVLKYVDAMPDSGLSFQPTKGVRTFAQQIEHLIQAFLYNGTSVVASGAKPPLLGDPGVYLKNKAALKEYVKKGFDYTIGMVQNLPAADYEATVKMFDIKRTRWQWFLGLQDHATWTLGQTVPYLRLNGVTPPQYLPF